MKIQAGRAKRVAQVVECLPSKWEALSSNPSTRDKKERCRQEFIPFQRLSGRSLPFPASRGHLHDFGYVPFHL
jgi:hypothetical protein